MTDGQRSSTKRAPAGRPAPHVGAMVCPACKTPGLHPDARRCPHCTTVISKRPSKARVLALVLMIVVAGVVAFIALTTMIDKVTPKVPCTTTQRAAGSCK